MRSCKLSKRQWIIFTLTASLLTGCAPKNEVTLIPVKCEVALPARPMKTGVTEIDIISILKYTEILENDLNFCIKGNTDGQ